MNTMLGKVEWADRILKALFTSVALDGGEKLAAFPPLGMALVLSPRERMGLAGPLNMWAIMKVPVLVDNQISLI
jgi:hypothetical protein